MIHVGDRGASELSGCLPHFNMRDLDNFEIFTFTLALRPPLTPPLTMFPQLPSLLSYQIRICLLIIILSYRTSTLPSNLLTDCDEVYNYYEPLHFVLYGYGLQTWEYAEEYALRTYAYLMPAAGVVKAVTVVLQPLVKLR